MRLTIPTPIYQWTPAPTLPLNYFMLFRKAFEETNKDKTQDRERLSKAANQAWRTLSRHEKHLWQELFNIYKREYGPSSPRTSPRVQVGPNGETRIVGFDKPGLEKSIQSEEHYWWFVEMAAANNWDDLDGLWGLGPNFLNNPTPDSGAPYVSAAAATSSDTGVDPDFEIRGSGNILAADAVDPTLWNPSDFDFTPFDDAYALHSADLKASDAWIFNELELGSQLDGGENLPGTMFESGGS
ncbi:hypothetical protein EST38_g6007 [Candolleomyces aberdarensis]|uniref:Uncharacterized protein n=1 Tax=Candolleomyces aberdarensis TaxID=2316362 RepID=A0A4Q2DM50_9AGAR|nr:hypothetical protein EST38_g6007 [Candolleomyces aberdarensis]